MGQHHVRIYAEHEGTELVGIADPDSKRAGELAEKYPTKVYDNYLDLLDQGLDAVSIATPTVLHHDIALAAIERGIHVLVEKPIADSLEAAKDLKRAAEMKGVTLMVGHIERFNPVVAHLKKHIDDGVFGDIVHMSAKRVGPVDPRIKDVGIIIDVGVHDIDIMSYLYGSKIDGTYAIAGNGGTDIETHAQVSLKFENGASGIIETNRLTPRKIRELTVTGTKCVATADYINQTLDVKNGKWESNEDLVKQEPLKCEIDHFLDCARTGNPPLITADHGIHALEVAMAAVESYTKNSYTAINEPPQLVEFHTIKHSMEDRRRNQNQHLFPFAPTIGGLAH